VATLSLMQLLQHILSGLHMKYGARKARLFLTDTLIRQTSYSRKIAFFIRFSWQTREVARKASV
jgi:hypothetical protein